MKILKDVNDYCETPYTTMNYYTKGESSLYKVAFLVLAILYALVWGLKNIFLAITSPVWLVPYLIWLKVRGE